MSRLITQFALLFVVAFGMMVSQTLLRKGMVIDGPVTISPAGIFQVIARIVTTPTLLAGYAVGGITTLVWLVTLSHYELSHALPILVALYFTMVLVVSRLMLQEAVSLGRWAGVALILLGMVVITRSG